uniref:RNA helicase n=1 Tax=Hucho hucho TaxID=62062 RepID=A0A4W5PIN3_9TELE
ITDFEEGNHSLYQRYSPGKAELNLNSDHATLYLFPFTGYNGIAQAQSGTGKTATFAISILQQLDIEQKGTQALVLYIQKVILALGDYMGAACHACIRGTNVLVVGTPGWVFDMLNRRYTDEYLNSAFPLVMILTSVSPNSAYVVLLSATMPTDVLEETSRSSCVLLLPSHFFQKWKLNTLFIFLNTSIKVDWLTGKIHSRDFTISALHGDMDQKESDVIMREFRADSSRVLITTDLMARGIDVQQVSLVINYDLATNRENYVQSLTKWKLCSDCIVFGKWTWT